MFVEDAEAVDIAGMPWLAFPAEMQDRGGAHDPVHGAGAGASDQVVVVVSGIVIPDSIVKLQDPVSVQAVQDILVWEQELFSVFPDETKDVFGDDFTTP